MINNAATARGAATPRGAATATPLVIQLIDGMLFVIYVKQNKVPKHVGSLHMLWYVCYGGR